jgi:two-component sensor histidine kinase
MTSWNLLADLCFSDLLLWAPFPGAGGSLEDERLVVIGQVRPTTSQTLFEIDLVGQVVAAGEQPVVAEALSSGQITSGEERADDGEGHHRLECIPVRHAGKTIAAVCRVWSPSIARRRGALERIYLDLFHRLAVMVTDGVFPFDDDEMVGGHRVGDGVMVVDEIGRVTFASPNAVSAMHRIGITSAINGSTLQAVGLDTTIVAAAFSIRLPVLEEIERQSGVTLLLLCIPLIATGEVTGALILLRDLTDLRSRDRLLMTKDATIREVHHRVKNNLQTISSLLRLQGRRIETESGRVALAEAERRIRAIAVVHEILSREAGDQVPFDEIVHVLVQMAKESSAEGSRLAVNVSGELGDIPADMATPLAVVVAELVQNAIEHAFPEGPEAAEAGEPRIELEFGRGEGSYEVTVRDNGIGLPAGFAIDSTQSLGLSIVRDLVRTQLMGTIAMRSDGGTLVAIEVPGHARVRP